MPDRLLADVLVAAHFAFVLFVLFGGLLVLRSRWWAALHLPAVAWAAFVEFTATLCPLTPWENALRRRAGEAGYGGGFIDHYLVPVLYPAGLTPRIQLLLGAFVLALNAMIYLRVLRNARKG